jgi:hypothetical protein
VCLYISMHCFQHEAYLSYSETECGLHLKWSDEFNLYSYPCNITSGPILSESKTEIY